MINQSKKKHGFTLIELLVAASIFATVMAIGLSAVVILAKSQGRSGAQGDVQREANLAVERIGDAVKNTDLYGYSFEKNAGGDITETGGIVLGASSLRFHNSNLGDRQIFTIRKWDSVQNAYVSFTGTEPADHVDNTTKFECPPEARCALMMFDKDNPVPPLTPQILSAFPLTSKDVNVTKLRFSGSKRTCTPTSLCPPNPYVTIDMEVASAFSQNGKIDKVRIHTTFIPFQSSF